MTTTTRRVAAFAFTMLSSGLLLLGSVGPATTPLAAPLAPTTGIVA